MKKVKVTQSCLTLWDPMDWGLTGSSVHRDSPRKNTRVGKLFPSPGDLPNPGIESRPLALQADSLLSELPGKPKSTQVGRLSLLQQIFLTQEWNQDLPHCRQILYQLSYQRAIL